MRVGKSAAKLKNGDRAEAEADRKCHQPDLYVDLYVYLYVDLYMCISSFAIQRFQGSTA